MPSLREHIEIELKDIEDFYHRLALTDEDYDKVYHAEIDELPPMMDAKKELLNELISAKLKGETNIASPIYTHRVIWNLELDMDGLKDISYNDGRARTLTEIARLNGWKDLEKRATMCVYND